MSGEGAERGHRSGVIVQLLEAAMRSGVFFYKPTPMFISLVNAL